MRLRLHLVRRHLTVVLFALGLALSSMASAQSSSLSSMVQQLSAFLPVKLDEHSSFLSISYSNNTVHFTIQSDLVNIDALKQNDKNFRSNILQTYANNETPEFQMLIDAILQEKALLKVTLQNNAGESYSMTFTSQELAAARTKQPNPEKELESIVANAKLQLPLTMSEGLVQTDQYLTKSYLYCVITCDESLYSIDMIKTNEDALRQEILRNATSSALFQATVKPLKATSRGIAYTYTGKTSRKSHTIFIEPDEL